MGTSSAPTAAGANSVDVSYAVCSLSQHAVDERGIMEYRSGQQPAADGNAPGLWSVLRLSSSAPVDGVLGHEDPPTPTGGCSAFQCFLSASFGLRSQTSGAEGRPSPPAVRMP